MWIKHTTVRTKSGVYTYIQLVQTHRIGGRTRHQVVANLGRMDRLDMEQVEAMVRTISSSTQDSLEMEQLLLLPTKKYGPSMLLQKLVGTSGIRRFLTDLALYKKMSPDTIYGVFALLTYYMTNEDGALPFFDWLKRYDLPKSEAICPALLESAFLLLTDTFSIRGGLLSPRKERETCYHYTYRSVNDNLRQIGGDAVIMVTLNRNFLPVGFQSLKQAYQTFTLPFPQDMFVSDSLPLLEECGSFDPQVTPFLCKIKRGEAARLFRHGDQVADFARSEGRFLNYKGIGYRTWKFEGKTVVVTRPGPGYAQAVTANRPEPREILVSNLEIPPEQALEHFLYLDKIQSYFFNLYLPAGLEFLYEKLPARTILHSILNLIFIKILCSGAIERLVREIGLTAEDAFRECETILSARLYDGNSVRHFHSKLTPAQLEILERVGIQNHPAITFSLLPKSKP